MKLRTLSFLLGLLLMQCAFLSQAQDSRFSKVFYNPTGLGMHVLASAEAGLDSLMMISRERQYGVDGAVHLMDATGVMHWSKSLKRDESWIMPVDIVRTADDNFLICASEVRGGNNSILLIKLNVAGDLLWVKKFEHEINVFPSGIALSAGGDILVTGRAVLSESLYKSKLLLIRFTEDGSLLWSKTFETASLKDEGVAVAELADGQLIIGGSTRSSGEYGVELSLIQTDADGNVLWAKQKLTHGYHKSKINDLIVGPSGFYLSGSADDAEGMVMAINMDGETIWSKRFFASGFDWDESVYRGRINITAGGNLLMSFGSIWSAWGAIYQFSAEGSYVWAQIVDGPQMEARSLSDGGYLFLGIGRIMVVKGMEGPQTGVIRTNALGEGVLCTSPFGTSPIDDYFPVFENLTYTVTDGGSVGDYLLQWEEFLLESHSGCVDFYGAVEQTPDAANTLTVFPNPGNGPFRLMLEDMQPESLVQLTVFNSMGQNLYSREGDWSRIQMIDSKLPAGLYLINLKTVNGVFTARLIVK